MFFLSVSVSSSAYPRIAPETSCETVYVGKSMPFQNHMNRISGRDQIPANEGKPIFILIFQKCNAHFFLEKATEISGLKTGDVCNLVQRDWFLVMFCNIIQYGIKTVHFLLTLVDILMENFHAEIVIQLKQKFKDQTVKTQKIPVRADIIDDLKLFQTVCSRTALYARKRDCNPENDVDRG